VEKHRRNKNKPQEFFDAKQFLLLHGIGRPGAGTDKPTKPASPKRARKAAAPVEYVAPPAHQMTGTPMPPTQTPPPPPIE
jgi:hypothetical protein